MFRSHPALSLASSISLSLSPLPSKPRFAHKDSSGDAAIALSMIEFDPSVHTVPHASVGTDDGTRATATAAATAAADSGDAEDTASAGSEIHGSKTSATPPVVVLEPPLEVLQVTVLSMVMHEWAD